MNAFKGKTVLVTGSSRNLGKTIAGSFAAVGARVVVHGSNERVFQTRDGLQQQYPDAELMGLPFSLADESAIRTAFDDLAKKDWVPDVLVNNAAHLGLGDPKAPQQDIGFFREVMEVNLFGAFLCSQLAARHMLTHGGGAIVNISSLAGQQGIPGRPAYNISKAAMDGMTRSLAQELAGSGIRVNALVLGYVWTERWQELSKKETERRKKNNPSGMPSSQEEIARAVQFLASDTAPTLTGAQLVLDGGLHVQQLPRDITV